MFPLPLIRKVETNFLLGEIIVQALRLNSTRLQKLNSSLFLRCERKTQQNEKPMDSRFFDGCFRVYSCCKGSSLTRKQRACLHRGKGNNPGRKIESLYCLRFSFYQRLSSFECFFRIERTIHFHGSK